MSTVVLDSHVVHWWSAESDRISTAASKAISDADELAVADISWFELAWLARHERIVVTIRSPPGSSIWPGSFARSR